MSQQPVGGNLAIAHLDEVAWEFFGSEIARDAVRQKVEAIFPPHELESFTEHFWGLIQQWRRWEKDQASERGPRREDL